MRKFILATMVAMFFSQSDNVQAQILCGHIVNKEKVNLVVFINGINNQPSAACASLGSLREVVSKKSDDFDFDLKYNPTSTSLVPTSDVRELLIQAQISDRAHNIAQNDLTIRVKGIDERYQYVLGKLYVDKIRVGKYASSMESEVYVRAEDVYSYLKAKVKLGKNVIVVAHSQGNYLVEAAVAIMHYKGEQNLISHIRVVGIAPVASTTPSGTYISHTDDRAVNLHRGQTAGLKYFSVLPVNVNACVANVSGEACDGLRKLSDTDWTAHGFVSAYLNQKVLDNEGTPLPNKLHDYIQIHTDSLKYEPKYIRDIDTSNVEAPNPSVTSQRIGRPYTVAIAARWDSEVFSFTFYSADNSNNVLNHIWDFGDGDTEKSTASSMSHTFNPSGTYRVTLTTTFRDGRVSKCVRTFIMDAQMSSREYDRKSKQTACE
jgi:PKD domain